MKIGAHCVLFKERIASETAEILNEIKKAGFAGFEMGARFFSLEDKDKLTDAMAQSGIELFGLHAAAMFPELAENKESASERLLNAARFLEDMPNKNIIMSSMQFDGCDKQAAAKNLNDIVLRCADVGVTVHYHNHAGEFINDMEVFKILAENAPALQFGVDLGWVYVAGCEPLDILKTYGARINYVHLRDAKTRDREGFTELGEGSVDFPALMSALHDVEWAVVEYEDGLEDIQRYANARKFLQGLGY